MSGTSAEAPTPVAPMVQSIVERLGRGTRRMLAAVGSVSRFVWATVVAFRDTRTWAPETLEQLRRLLLVSLVVGGLLFLASKLSGCALFAWIVHKAGGGRRVISLAVTVTQTVLYNAFVAAGSPAGPCDVGVTLTPGIVLSAVR